MIDNNFADISDWIRYSSDFLEEKKQKAVSFHVDEVDFIHVDDLNGLDLLDECCKFLKNAKKQLRVFKPGRSLYPLVVIPLGCSEVIEFWSEEFLSFIGNDDEPISIYLCDSNNIFNLDDQEYRCRIHPVYDDVMILYRCHRSFDSYQKDWEFSKDIYLLPI